MITGLLLPRKYFVVTGKGLSRTSPLMAFDNALRSAGISALNLVPVSSILPPDIEEEEPRRLPYGSVVFLVMSEKRAKGPARISAGISWARGKPYGYVIEIHDADSLSNSHRALDAMWEEIAGRGEFELEEPRYAVEELEVPAGYYGSVVAALVFSEIEVVEPGSR